MTEKNEAAAALARIPSDKRTAARRANIAKANARERTVKPCDCGTDPHKRACPAYQRERIRRIREKQKEQAE